VGHTLTPARHRFADGSWDWDKAEKQARHIYETYYHIRKL
jgi:hypothetical protein